MRCSLAPDVRVGERTWPSRRRSAARVGSVPHVHPVPVRDDLRGARGLPLAAGRRAGPAEHERVARRRRRPRGATRSPPRCRGSSGTATPTAAPSALRDAIADRMHGVAPDQVFAANGSNEVLQTLLLAYAGPGRTRGDVRADVPAPRPHRPAHRRDGRRGERGADFTLDLAAALGADRRGTGRWSRSCARRTTRPGSSSRATNVRAFLDAAPGLLVVDEAYAQFATGRR